MIGHNRVIFMCSNNPSYFQQLKASILFVKNFTLAGAMCVCVCVCFVMSLNITGTFIDHSEMAHLYCHTEDMDDGCEFAGN